MKRLLAFFWSFCLVAGLSGTAWAQDDGVSFEFGARTADNSTTVTVDAGSDVVLDVAATLATSYTPVDPPVDPPGDELDSEDPGAQGWTLSLSSAGCDVTAITLEALGSLPDSAGAPALAGGFEQTELAPVEAGDPPASNNTGDCEGRTGAVSAVVLNLTKPVTLDPTAVHDVANLQVTATAPAEADTCVPCLIEFTDGCRGSGQPVQNKVTYKGQTQNPAKGTLSSTPLTVDICARGIPCSAKTNEVSLMWHAEPLPQGELDVPHQTDVPFDGLLSADVEEPAVIEVQTADGATAQKLVYAGLASVGLKKQDAEGNPTEEDANVQGWTISIGVSSGDLEIVEVTLDNTAGAKALAGGFDQTETTPQSDPNESTQQCTGLTGAVSAVVLSLTKPVTLFTTGTASILQLDVVTTVPQGDEDIEGTIDYTDGCKGSGQPVVNKATVSGKTVFYCARQQLIFRSTKPAVSQFLRGDPNDDGKGDIADAIWIVNELFRSGDETGCPDASDVNADGIIDLSDAVYIVDWQFRGGSAPPAPYPGCAVDPNSTVESCPGGSVTACP